MGRTLLERIHNPHAYECGCDPDCWCQRTSVGRAVKWWFPARYFGLRHKNRELEEWKQRDPITNFEAALAVHDGVSSQDIDAARARAETAVAEALQRALDSPEPDPGSRFDYVWAAGA